MKKLIGSLVLLLGVGLVAGKLLAGETAGIPTSQYGQGIQHSDYVGVRVSTAAFKADENFVVTVTTERAKSPTGETISEVLVYGVNFSSGTTIDFVVIRDTAGAGSWGGSSGQAVGNPVAMVFNTAHSTGGIGAISAGFMPIDPPIRLFQGLSWNTNTSNYNLITVHYHIKP